MERVLEKALLTLSQQGLYRQLRLLQGEQAPRVTLDGRTVLLFSSNNYLGLTNHPRLKRAAQVAVERLGCGAASSRLISGNMELHEQLEERLAQFKGTEAALVFSTGYMANVGVLSSLMGRGDVIFSDALNHASIIDGCRLSGATVRVFPHKDLDALEGMLGGGRLVSKRLIVVDGIFSMDGDLAPLPEIVELARRFGCWVMVDEAHATGVLGKRGTGSVEHFGLEGQIQIQMGTLGKGLGGFGAYVVGSRCLREYLINRCRSFIYTTALPPMMLAVACEALAVIQEEPWIRERLWSNVAYMQGAIKAMGYDTMGSETPIIPILVGDERLTMRFSAELLKAGVFVCGIRPPTVPAGTARLRLTVSAAHNAEDMDCALQALSRLGRGLGIIA